jgi:hypothetical protein
MKRGSTDVNQDVLSQEPALHPLDTGMLDIHEILVSEIGLTRNQSIAPEQAIPMPARLSLPYPPHIAPPYRPLRELRFHGRQRFFSCEVDQPVRNELVDGYLRLSGVDEIGVQFPTRRISGGNEFVVTRLTVSGFRIRSPSSSPPPRSIWQKRK